MNGTERDRLDTIEAKVDTVIVKMEYVERMASDHEERIRACERWKLSIPVSALVALAALVGAIVRG